MSNESLAGLIRRAIGGRTLNQFCAEAGLNAGNLSRVLRGQKASADVLQKVAENAYNGVTAADLLCAAGYLEEKPSEKILIYGTAAAGLPMFANEDVSGYLEMSALPGGPDEYFALRVSGNSMDLAHIPDGSVVVAHRQSDLADGEIGVFMVDDGATVKKLVRVGGHVMLMPISTDAAHQPQVYDATTSVSVLGKVVKCVVDI